MKMFQNWIWKENSNWKPDFDQHCWHCCSSLGNSLLIPLVSPSGDKPFPWILAPSPPRAFQQQFTAYVHLLLIAISNFTCWISRPNHGDVRVHTIRGLAWIPEKKSRPQWQLLQGPGCKSVKFSYIRTTSEVCAGNCWWHGIPGF